MDALLLTLCGTLVVADVGPAGPAGQAALPAARLAPRDAPPSFVCLADELVQRTAAAASQRAPDGAAPNARSPGTDGAIPPPGTGDDGSLVDVLFVYNAGAVSTVGSEPALLAQLDVWVADTNTALRDSDVDVRVRLVGAELVSYVHSGSIITDVQRLKNPSDGFLDGVHASRDAVAADLVSLVVDSGAAGTAFQMDVLSTSFEDSAFSVVSAVSGSVVFAHEAGHNMGLGHNNEAGQSALLCYAFGHRTPGDEFRTIMSNPPGVRVELFSNPDLSAGGFPLGIDGTGCPPGAADAARALGVTSPFAANFRVSADGGNAFVDLGGALAGGGGAPSLTGAGTLVPGSAGSIVLTNAAPSAPALFLLSLTSTPVPFKGGTLQAVPAAISLVVTTGPAGDVPIGWSAWGDVPPDAELYFQYAIQDAGAPFGVAISNAVVGTTR